MMALRQELVLSQRLEQKLVLTPQLQMAIKLLQLTRLELSQHVAKELEENPTLEDGEGEEEGPALGAGNEEDEPVSVSTIDGLGDDEETPSPERNEEILTGRDLERELLRAQDTDKSPEMDWDSYFDSYQDERESDWSLRDPNDDDRPGIEQYVTRETTLHDYLVWQLTFAGLDDDTLAIATEIVGNINEDGYLAEMTPADLAARLGKSEEEVMRVHQRVLRLDPVGVGARDLRECLLAQARFGETRDALATRILADHWELLEKRNFLKLGRLLKVSREELEAALRIISRYNPRPGGAYDTERVDYITPDIYVTRVGDEYHIQLNEDGLPRLHLSSYYQRALADKNGPKETREFIKGKLRSATWLIRSIHQRQRTIYRVTEAIVRHQRDFLDLGVSHLKPMVLRDIAEDIGMHECTVSRVTTGKYVHTPQGIFELKYFFKSGITNTEGEDISSESIKEKIRAYIENENSKKPLSDQLLVQMLKRDGMDVARRTVAKYREMMGILSSSGRRRSF